MPVVPTFYLLNQIVVDMMTNSKTYANNKDATMTISTS